MEQNGTEDVRTRCERARVDDPEWNAWLRSWQLLHHHHPPNSWVSAVSRFSKPSKFRRESCWPNYFKLIKRSQIKMSSLFRFPPTRHYSFRKYKQLHRHFYTLPVQIECGIHSRNEFIQRGTRALSGKGTRVDSSYHSSPFLHNALYYSSSAHLILPLVIHCTNFELTDAIIASLRRQEE